MDLSTSSDIPHSDDLAALLTSPDECPSSLTKATTFSDEIHALHETEAETQRLLHAQGNPVQHRSWTTKDVFHSDPEEFTSSQAMATGPFITSSPPPTPSPPKKRKFAELKLGENTLARPPKAQRTYYGINIHQLLDEAKAEEDLPPPVAELPTPPAEQPTSKKASLLWTEKYRARKFTDLIGDERTHRAVMHWLKRWDPIVYPGTQRSKTKKSGNAFNPNGLEEKAHRKILLLTGPPGLGKTTLAHVCAKQAGFEVQEINASDERSGNVVKGRIRDMVGTENVKGTEAKTVEGSTQRKAGKPVCVIVDEVDGVVSGTGGGGGGEGGFIKALLDLVMLDAKNSSPLGSMSQAPTKNKKDRFRLLRPLILICNDIYAPALRGLRQSTHAEIIHVRKPPVQSLVSRLQGIFERERVPADVDGVRRLCEATWGISSRKEDKNGAGAGEGDMRGILVVGEWVAGKVRALRESTGDAQLRLTRRWVEENILSDLSHGGGAARGLGRGGPKDIVDRVFQEGAGFPRSSNTFQTPMPSTTSASTTPQGVAESAKRTATTRLRELLDTHGESDRILTDVFTSYPSHPFQDDTFLSKPAQAYEWLHFHDALSSAVYSSNEWELAPYLSTPVLGMHHLFATPTRAQYQASLNQPDDPEAAPAHPFTGPGALWVASETHKSSLSNLQALQSSLSLELSRAFNSPSAVATDLLPYLLRMLNPNINPTIVGGKDGGGTASVRKASEQACASRAVNAMSATGVRFEKTKVTHLEDAGVLPSSVGFGQKDFIYRMAPSLDELGTFATGGKVFTDAAGAGVSVGGNGSKARFAVRQHLEQEFLKAEKARAETARLARFGYGLPSDTPGDQGQSAAQGAQAGEKLVEAVKRKQARDFFGRPIIRTEPEAGSVEAVARENRRKKARVGVPEDEEGAEGRVWVTYHEGFSNAVKKPISIGAMMLGL